MRYYKRIDKQGNILTVESYSHDIPPASGAIEIEEKEYLDFISSLPEPIPAEPAPDLITEIANLKQEVTNLKEIVLLLEKIR